MLENLTFKVKNNNNENGTFILASCLIFYEIIFTFLNIGTSRKLELKQFNIFFFFSEKEESHKVLEGSKPK